MPGTGSPCHSAFLPAPISRGNITLPDRPRPADPLSGFAENLVVVAAGALGLVERLICLLDQRVLGDFCAPSMESHANAGGDRKRAVLQHEFRTHGAHDFFRNT